MKLSQKYKSQITLSVLLCFSLFANKMFAAEIENKEGFFNHDLLKRTEMENSRYAGAGILVSEAGLVTGRRVSGNVTSTAKSDNNDSSFSLFGGLHYNENVDLEFRLQQLGEFTHRLEYIDASKNTQAILDTDLEFQSIDFVVLPKYPLGSRFELGAEAGLYYASVDRSTRVNVEGKLTQKELTQLQNTLQDSIGGGSESEAGFGYGLFLAYNMKTDWLVRYAMQWKEVDGDEIFAQSISLGRSF